MSDVAIRVEHLSKQFRITERTARYRTLRDSLAEAIASSMSRQRRKRTSEAAEETVWALDDVSFEVERGDVVGIVGRNGAGKSTLLKVLSRITEPTRGFAEIRGCIGSLLEVGTGFHNELTGRENIFLNGAILGMRSAEIKRRFDEIVSFAEVERFVDTPVKHYSTGMYLRLAFAVAAHLEPDILLVDEVLAVGDVAFQNKCLGKMNDVAREGRTVLFVSHNMGAIRSLCRTALVMDQGRIAASGDVAGAVETYYRLVGALRSQSQQHEGAGTFGHVVVNDGVPTVASSDSLSVSTTLAVPDNVTGYALYCTLSDMHGRRVFTVVTSSGQTRPGRYAVRLHVPPLWLATGLYSLHFKTIFWGGFQNSRAVSDHVPVDVVGEQARSDAVLVPPAEWAVDPCSRVPQPTEQRVQ